MDERKRHEVGTKMRRKLLGDAHVERAKAHETELTADFQDLLTRYAWGEIWTRPGINQKTRSMLTIGMLVALNRNDELRLHLRAAFKNGVTQEEIREVLLHSAIYCGLPAANSAFHIASEVLQGEK